MNMLKKMLMTGVVFIMTAVTPVFAAEEGLVSFPAPVDSSSWVLPEDMTWDDYQPVPGINWNEVDLKGERLIKGALVVVDFQDRDFILTQAEGSEIAGNPIGMGNVPRDEIGQFWVDFLNKPQPINHYRTINEFWKENSFGKWEIELEAFGPYRLDGNEFEYGLNEFGQQVNMPPGFRGRNLRSEAMEKAQGDMDASGETFDFTFILHAGYDESGVWQEFGEMMFSGPEEVTDEFGPPYDGMKNWANTRYVEWTSWVAAKSIWSSADIRNGISVQGENDGMATFAHEFGHIMSLLDNYNNPYGNPVSRSYSGPWELMSRGSFNGPGGPHTRWMVMPTLGGSAPSHHMLRNKIKQGFLTEDDYINVHRDELAETGPIFADIIAREVPTGEAFGRTGLYGINIEMEDWTPPNSLDDDWRADMQRGAKWYDNYTIEVVDRIGFDSFLPDSGVLLAKTKNAESAPNIWVIDAHPEDMNQVDFTRPDGTEAMYSKGDYRQLSDSLFKAGTAEGVVSEFQDEHNRLHFYMLNKNEAEDGTLSYRIAVRHLDGAGDYQRSISVSEGEIAYASPGRIETHHIQVTNTGNATDLIRIEVENAAKWDTQIMHNVLEVEAGETKNVPVYVMLPKVAASPTTLTVTVSSETDFEQVEIIEKVLLNDLSANGIRNLVTYYEDQEAFANPSDAHALRTHMTAVAHFEDQGQHKKVLKHMQGFIALVEQMKKTEGISEKMADTLIDYANRYMEIN